jgi:uncharacterized protein
MACDIYLELCRSNKIRRLSLDLPESMIVEVEQFVGGVTMDFANSIDFDVVWDHVVSEFRGDPSSIHGPSHWRRVEANGLKIAAINHASTTVVRLFAVLHDSRRTDDSSERIHGELAAEYAATLRGELFDLDDQSFELLQDACRSHTHGRLSSEPTIGACWDADRLDLGRVGIIPDPNLMSTAPGKEMAASTQKIRSEEEADALLEEVRRQILLRSNSVNRMDRLLDYCPLLRPYGLGSRIIQFREWLHLVGENWSSCDVITPYRKTLKSVLGHTGPIRELMDAEENAAYDMLQDTVTVYRGCDANQQKGLCWSLDEQKANAFPFQSRFRAKEPVLIRARAKKIRILALKLDRNEAEIIAFSPRIYKVQPADEAAAHRLLDVRLAAQNHRLSSVAQAIIQSET